MPAVGKLALSPMLNEKGKLIGDFTISRYAQDKFLLVCSLAAEDYYLRWFERHLPTDGVVVPRRLDGLSRPVDRRAEARASCCRSWCATTSPTQAFPFLSFRKMDIGMIPALVGRVSFTGELGYEIWVRPEYQRALLCTCCWRPASRSGSTQFGMRALLCMRLEKSFGTWFREYRPIYGPYEAGLGRFVDLKKNDFIGRDAAARGKGERRQAAAVDLRGRRDRRRRDRRRADLARRQGDRLGDLGRLRPYASASRWRWAISRRRTPTRATASRSRSSASAGRRSGSPRRPMIRRGCGCDS